MKAHIWAITTLLGFFLFAPPTAASDHESVTAAPDKTTGYGMHARPWAQDLLKGESSPAVPLPLTLNDPGVLALCRKGEEAWQARLLALKAAESALTERAVKLEALRADLERLLDEQQRQEQADTIRLVNLYRTMKPSVAANILADLDTPVVVSILMAMNEREASAILANMPKDAAQKVTLEIANRRSLERMAKNVM